MKPSIPFLLLLTLAHICAAQSAVTSAGGDASGAGGSASYSIGQVSFIQTSGSTGSVQEGVQQSYEISPVYVDDSMENIQLSIYPNPVNDALNIRISELDSGLKATILDSKGNMVETIALKSPSTAIDVSNWAPSIYFIEITNPKGSNSRFKLVKN